MQNQKMNKLETKSQQSEYKTMNKPENSVKTFIRLW